MSDDADLSLFRDVATLCHTRDCEHAARQLAWARAHPNVHVVSASVETRYLPPGCSLTLHDFKVKPLRKGPPTDDAVYAQNHDVWVGVSRGNCIGEWGAAPPGGAEGPPCFVAVRSMRKFTGGPCDDDDADDEADGADADAWRAFFLGDPASADKVVSMDKVNGEAAHLACRRAVVGGRPWFLIFVGSKNVHCVMSAAEEDVQGDRWAELRDQAAALKTPGRTLVAGQVRETRPLREQLLRLLH